MPPLGQKEKNYLASGGALTNGQIPTQIAKTGQENQTINSAALSPIQPLNIPPAPQDNTSNYLGTLNSLDTLLSSTPTATETNVSNTSDTLASLYKRINALGGTANDQGQIDATGALPTAQDKAAQSLGYKNYADLQTQLSDVNNQIQATTKEALAIPLQLQEQAKGRGITAAGLAPDQAGQIRQNTLKALGLSSIAQTLQGNVARAEDIANKAVQAEFLPLQTELNYQKNIYALNKDALDRQDKKSSEKLGIYLNERTRLLNNDQEDKKTALGMAAAAVKNNPSDQAAQQAAQRALSLDPLLPGYLDNVFSLVGQYQSDPSAIQKGLLDQEYTRAQIDQIKANTAKIKAEAVKAQPGQFDLTTPSGQLSAIAQNLTSKFSSKFSQDAFIANIDRLGNSGDAQQLADYIFSEALSQVPDTDAKKRAIGNYLLTQKLVHLQNLFNDYVAKNGDTNLFKGTKENIYQKLGTVDDPALRAIGTEIADTVDQLARVRTGAVINDQEEKLYQSLLPGINKTLSLNTATINGLTDSLSTDMDNLIKFQLTGSGLDTIKPYLDVNYQTPQPSSAYDPYAQARSEVPAGQILVIRKSDGQAGYIPKNEFNLSEYNLAPAAQTVQ